MGREMGLLLGSRHPTHLEILSPWIMGVKRHISYALELPYWSVWSQKHSFLPPIVTLYHHTDGIRIELFPNKHFLPEDVLIRLKEIVMLLRQTVSLLKNA